MTDAAFIWDTNIEAVAQRIQSGLAKIQGSMAQGIQQRGGGGIAGLDRFLAPGIEGRVKKVANELQTNLTRVAHNYEKALKQAADAGTPFRGVEGSRSFRQLTRGIWQSTAKEFEQVARSVSQGLAGLPAREVQPIISDLRRMAGMVGENFQRGVLDTERQLRRRYGDTMPAPGRAAFAPERDLATTFERAVQRGMRGAGAGVADPHALDSLLHQGGMSRADITRANAAVQKATTEAVRMQQETERVLNEIRANATARGRSSTAARQVGQMYIDARGNRYTPQFDEEGPTGLLQRTGVQPGDSPSSAMGRYEQWLRQAEDNEFKRRRHLDETRAGERQFKREQENILRERRTLLGRQLAQSVEAGQARMFGGGRMVERDGRFYQLRRGGEAEEIRTPLERRRAEEVLTKELRQREQAERRASEATRRQAVVSERAQAQQAAPTGTRAERFMAAARGQTGVRGFRFEDILQSGFSLARYTLSAAVIGGTIMGLSKIKQAVVDYRDSLTDLEIALQRNEAVSESFISGLSDVARVAGANTGDAIDAAVRGIRAFRAEDVDEDALGTKFADIAAQLAVIAEKDLRDATGDLVAIGSAFDLTADQFGRVTDSVAIAKRELGGSAKEISQGLAAVGTSASAVGFSLEETANLISLVQARTDQSGRAVATRLSRSFSIIGGSSGRSAIEALNRQLDENLQIDTTGTVRDQLLAVSELYNDLTDAQQNLIRNALGGTANMRELLPILTEPDALARALDVQLGGAGAGMDEFNRKANDLVGILRKIRGDIEGIFTGLFRAGAFDIIGATVKYGLEPMLNTIRQMVNAFNDLTSSFRGLNVLTDMFGGAAKHAIALVVQVTLLNKLLRTFGASRVGEAIAQRLAVARTAATPVRAVPVVTRGAGIAAQTSRAVSFGAAATAAGALQTLGRNIRGLAAAALGFLRANPLLTVALGITALVNLYQRIRAISEQIEATQANIASGQGLELTSPSDLRNRSQELDSVAQELDSQISGFFGRIADLLSAGAPLAVYELEEAANEQAGWLSRGIDSAWEAIKGAFTDTQATATIRAAEAQAELLRRQAETLEQAARGAARGAAEPWEVIDLSTPEGIADGLSLLEESGRSATTRLQALTQAMGQLDEAAQRSLNGLDALARLQFAQQTTREISSRLRDPETIQRLDFAQTAPLRPEQFQLQPGLQRERGIEDALAFALAGMWGPDPNSIIHDALARFSGDGPIGQRQARRGRRAEFDALGEALDPRLEELNDFVQELVDRTGGDLTDENIDRIKASTQEWAQRNIEGFADASEDVQQVMLDAIGEAIDGSISSFQDFEDPQAVINAFITARLQEAQAAARELELRTDLAGGDGAFAAAGKILREARQTRRAAIHKGATPEQLEQIDIEVLAAERDFLEQRRQKIDALSSALASQLAPTDDIGRLEEDLRRIREHLALSGISGPEREALEGQETAARYALADGRMRRAQAERAAAIDSRDDFASLTNEAANILTEIAVMEARGDTGSVAYHEAAGRLAEIRRQVADSIRESARAEARAAVDPRDTVGLAQLEAANAYQDMLHLQNDGLSSTQAYADAKARFAQAIVNGAKMNAATAAGVSQFLASSMREAVRITTQITNALLRQAGALQDGMIGRLTRQRVRSQIGVVQAPSVPDVDLSWMPPTLGDAGAFSSGGAAATSRPVGPARIRALADQRHDIAVAQAELRATQIELRQVERGTAEYWDAYASVQRAKIALADAELSATQAQRGAETDPRSTLQRAEVDLLNARSELRLQSVGSTAYWQAVGQVREAQVAYAEAQIRAASNARLAFGDVTDSVLKAREELRVASALLSRARADGAPQDVINDLLLGEQSARAGHQQAKFDRWMNDLETARQLGQISEHAYIRYLEQESNRLQNVANMTRQQQDQLNRVQLALKAAKEQIDSQFNIGSIRMPTPYEVRRAIAGGGGAFSPGSSFGSVVNSTNTVTNTVYVDGANIAEVEAVLRRLLGSQYTATYTSGGRRI